MENSHIICLGILFSFIEHKMMRKRCQNLMQISAKHVSLRDLEILDRQKENENNNGIDQCTHNMILLAGSTKCRRI